jgi:hypothetical protein
MIGRRAVLKTRALQTLRDCRASPNRAERLECGAFTATFGREKRFVRQSRKVGFKRQGFSFGLPASAVGNSEIVAEFAVLVLRIGDQLLISTIHHPIQVLQRNLADDVWQRIGNLHHIESSGAPLNLQSNR